MKKTKAGIGVIIANTINACEYHFCKYKNLNVKISVKEIDELFEVKKPRIDIDYSHDLERELSLLSYSSVSNAHIPMNSDYLKRKNYIFNSFFMFKHLDLLQSACKNYLTTKTLAVHLRGTDKSGEIPAPTTEQIKKSVVTMLEKHDIDRIFLATDDMRYQNEMLKYFGNLVVYESDKTISTNGKAIHLRRSRQGLNFEVIKDIYCLSQSPYFLYSFSNVSYLALILGIEKFQDTGCLNQFRM